MIRVTNGIHVFEVTRGAFDGIYSHQGYYIMPDSKNKEVEAEAEEKTEEKTEDDIFAEELLEKPISQWNKEEVKKFAAIKGINITGTKNPNQAKEIIKSFLEAE